MAEFDANLKRQRFKRLDYVYDLISGNVHRVDYQNGLIDQWHHSYKYDADNRITEVYTTTSTPLSSPGYGITDLQNELVVSPYWMKEAKYSYYKHGPLARTELGNEKVQGIDYVYTLQGWIKGVNADDADFNYDPGGDGAATGLNKKVGRDAEIGDKKYRFGYANNSQKSLIIKLDYFNVVKNILPSF